MQNYFKLYITVNKIIVVFFYVHSWRSACCDTNKKIPKVFNFTDPKFFESTELSGVGWVIANKQIFKNGLTLLLVGIKTEHMIKSTVKKNKQYF